MKRVKAELFATPIKVVRNTAKGSQNDQWAKIVNAQTGEVLHTGQVRYIRRVAKRRYNVKAEL